MIKRTAYILTCVIALALVFTGLLAVLPVKAQIDDRPVALSPVSPADVQPGETIKMSSQFPVLNARAGVSYDFEVTLTYSGMGFRLFNLKATVPPGFTYTIVPATGGSGIEITAIRLDGTKPYGDNIKLSVKPYAWQVPAPGTYPITLVADSGDLKTSLDLKAVVTASYGLKMSTPDDRLSAVATAGTDNPLTVVLTNTGTANLEKLTVSAPANNRPGDWTVKAVPEKIDVLKPGESKEIKITVRPSEKAIAGDYAITVQAEPEDRTTSARLQLRVTALTSGSWGWVGVGVVVVVAAALAIIFRKFGRR